MSPRATGRAGESERGCAFCRIVSGEAEAKVVFEDAISIAFLDARPLFPGHCLLISKQHYRTLADLPKEIVGPIFWNARALAITVEKVMKAEGTFVAVNNTVSQSVPHFHIHIVPRRRGDGLRGFFWPRRRYENEREMLAVQKLLSAKFK